MTLADLGNDPAAFGHGAQRLASLGDLQGAAQLATIQKTIAPETSPEMQGYKFAQAQGYKGTILDYAKEKAAAYKGLLKFPFALMLKVVRQTESVT